MSKDIANMKTWCLVLISVTWTIGIALQNGDRVGEHRDRDKQDVTSILPRGCWKSNYSITCIAADASLIPDFIDGMSPHVGDFTMKFADLAVKDGRMTLDNSAFPLLSDLTNLEISTSNLESIQTSTLRYVTKLKYLNLKNNRIKSLEPDIFDSCRLTLEVVNLSNNDLKALDQKMFVSLESLKHLDLSYNRLQSFACPFKSSAMNSLLLSGNPLTSASIDSKTITYTCNLDLSYTDISILQESMFSNMVCKASDKFQLSLRGNQITKVDTGLFEGFTKDFGKIDVSNVKWQLINRSALADFMWALTRKSLDYLDLSKSFLTQEVVKDFPLLSRTARLDTLDISGNIIGSTSKSRPLYVEHVCISTLRTLNLSANGHNQRLVFDKIIPQLEVLDLSHNAIPIDKESVVFYTNESAQSVPQLKVLIMTSAFEASPSVIVTFKNTSRPNITWFSGLDKLEELYLDNNYNLFESSEDLHMSTMFRGLVNLKYLSLARSNFGRRKFCQDELENMFQDQRTSLLSIDLRDNHILHRSLVILKGLVNLKVLDLRSNDIGYLTGDWYNPNLKQLYISDNSLLSVSPSTLDVALNNGLNLMTISGNPFTCYCSLAGFTAWLKKNAGFEPKEGKVYVPDLTYAKCMMPMDKEDTLIVDYQPPPFSCNQTGYILLGVFASLLLLVLIAMIVTLVTRSTDVRFYLRTRRGKRVASGGVFMGYCEGYRQEDFTDNPEQAWVHGNIPDRVEFNPDLPVHIKFMQPVNLKDESTMLGRQIVDQHEQFRVILFIMGPLFIEHYSNDVVTTVCANGNVMEGCKHKFVLVLIGGLKKKDLPAGMTQLKRYATCYEWPQSNRGRTIFWKKLLLKLSKKAPVCC